MFGKFYHLLAEQNHSTRQRLLEAAGSLFSEDSEFSGDAKASALAAEIAASPLTLSHERYLAQQLQVLSTVVASRRMSDEGSSGLAAAALGFLFVRFTPMWPGSITVLTCLAKANPKTVRPILMNQLLQATQSADPKLKEGKQFTEHHRQKESEMFESTDVGVDWMKQGSKHVREAALSLDAEESAEKKEDGDRESEEYMQLAAGVDKRVPSSPLWEAWTGDGREEECSQNAGLWLLWANDRRGREQSIQSHFRDGVLRTKVEIYGATDADTYHQKVCEAISSLSGIKATSVMGKTLVSLALAWTKEKVYCLPSPDGIRGESAEEAIVARTVDMCINVSWF